MAWCSFSGRICIFTTMASHKCCPTWMKSACNREASEPLKRWMVSLFFGLGVSTPNTEAAPDNRFFQVVLTYGFHLPLEIYLRRPRLAASVYLFIGLKKDGTPDYSVFRHPRF